MENKAYRTLLELATTTPTDRLQAMVDRLEPFTGSHRQARHLVDTFNLEIMAREQRALVAARLEGDR